MRYKFTSQYFREEALWSVFPGAGFRRELAYPHRKTLNVLAIQLSPPCSGLPIGQTSLLSPLQAHSFNEYALPLISFSSTTPLQNDGGQSRILTRTPGKSRITGTEEKRWSRSAHVKYRAPLSLISVIQAPRPRFSPHSSQ